MAHGMRTAACTYGALVAKLARAGGIVQPGVLLQVAAPSLLLEEPISMQRSCARFSTSPVKQTS